jgi:hypothetical protein
LGWLEEAPRLTDEAYEILRERNRKRVSLSQSIRDKTFTFTPTDGSGTSSERSPRQHEVRQTPPADDPSAPSEEW